MLTERNKCMTLVVALFLPRWQLPFALSPRWQLGWSSGRRCPPPWCNPVGPAGRWRTARSGCSSASSFSSPRTPQSSSAVHWYRAAGHRRGRFGPSPPGSGSSPSSLTDQASLVEFFVCLFCFVGFYSTEYKNKFDRNSSKMQLVSLEWSKGCFPTVEEKKKAVTAVPHRDEVAIVTRNSQSKMFSPRPKPGVASYSTGWAKQPPALSSSAGGQLPLLISLNNWLWRKKIREGWTRQDSQSAEPPAKNRHLTDGKRELCRHRSATGHACVCVCFSR